MALIARDFIQNDCATLVGGVHGIVTEAWGQGLMVGGAVVLLLITIASMRRRILLHKLILLELVLASVHGTFVFVKGSAYGWYTSSSAVLLYISYNLHNIINWIKIKPFLSKWASIVYIGTVMLAIPYWIVEIYFNFTYNNNLGSQQFRNTRPWEALCREPWWIFTSVYLLYVIKSSYSCSIIKLVRTSTRFGVLIASMTLSIAFIIADVIETITGSYECAGKNPYWKLTLIFKCLADAIFLDDFKSVLDRLTARTIESFGVNDPEAIPNGRDTGFDTNILDHDGSQSTVVKVDHAYQEPVLSNPSIKEVVDPVLSEQSRSKTSFKMEDFQSQHIERSRSPIITRPKTSGRKEWFDGVESD